MTLLPQSVPRFYSFEKKEWTPQFSYLPCFMSESESSIVLISKRIWNKSFTEIIFLYLRKIGEAEQALLGLDSWLHTFGCNLIIESEVSITLLHSTCIGASLVLNADLTCNKATNLKFTGTGNTPQRFRRCQGDHTASLLVTFSPVSTASHP